MIADLEATDAIIGARAVYYAQNKDVPGGSTGHVVVDEKVIGPKTEHQKLVKVHSVDVALIRARIAILEEISIQLGERVSKSEVTQRKRVREMTTGELHELLSEMTELEADQERRVRAAGGNIDESVN